MKVTKVYIGDNMNTVYFTETDNMKNIEIVRDRNCNDVRDICKVNVQFFIR